jgi:2-C-methyl-D-erythritol 4-phosphate cytidylyltransferase
MPDFAVILPAAGKSTRFGGRQKKPFVELEGQPLWLRTANLFRHRPDVCGVWLVVDAQDREWVEQRHGPTLHFLGIRLVNGGAERFESVANALAVLPAEAAYVAVHDAVRPLTSPALIEAVFERTRQTGAALAAVPVADTSNAATTANSSRRRSPGRGCGWPRPRRRPDAIGWSPPTLNASSRSRPSPTMRNCSKRPGIRSPWCRASRAILRSPPSRI